MKKTHSVILSNAKDLSDEASVAARILRYAQDDTACMLTKNKKAGA